MKMMMKKYNFVIKSNKISNSEFSPFWMGKIIWYWAIVEIKWNFQYKTFNTQSRIVVIKCFYWYYVILCLYLHVKQSISILK